MIIVPNPVINTYDVTSIVYKRYSWYEYSEFDNSRCLHRLDGPAQIDFYRGTLRDTRFKHSEMWYIHGHLHREDGPCIQKWYPNGQIKEEMWCIDGKYSRNDGPATLRWYENNTIKDEYWYINGVCHRLDGPSIQKWDVNGIIIKEEWHIDGVDISDQMNDIISTYELPHWSKWTSDERILVKLSLDI